MNILTKICVVLLVVASLVASVVFISLATVHPNYRTEFEQERQAYKRLELTCRSYAEAAKRSNAALAKARELAGKEKIELQSERDKAVSQVRQLELKLQTKENDLARIETKLANLSKSYEAMATLFDKQSEEISKSWARQTKLQQELVEMRDQWQQQQGRAERLAQNNRVLKEQAENLRQQNMELTQKVKDFEARGLDKEDMDVALTPENKISGTITAVQNNIASINIGSAHGLKKGMQLIVFRGGQFVGYLKIDRVDVNEAAGIMTKKVLAPMQGDKVTSSLN